MKKSIMLALVALLCLLLPLGVAAEKLTSCSIVADPVAILAGETVTVNIRIADNPGFTNLAIALDYDRSHLTLKSLEPADALTGGSVSVNEIWKDGDKDYGYVVCASNEPIKSDGILFTATFAVADGFLGDAQVTPKVLYIRNNEAVFSVFEEIRSVVTPCVATSVLAGDVTSDGKIEYNDVMLAYKAFLKEADLTASQLAAVDTNRNGTVEEAEYRAVYTIYIGG